MAVVLNIPLTFRFKPFRVKWTHRVGTWQGFAEARQNASNPIAKRLGSPEDMDAIISQPDLAGMLGFGSATKPSDFMATLAADGIPSQIRSPALSKPETDLSLLHDRQFEVLTCHHLVNSKPGKERDAWQMREDFFGIKRTTEALLAFLETWGAWDWSTLQRIEDVPSVFAPVRGISASVSLDSLFSGVELFIIPERIWELQDFYRDALTGSPAKWLRYADGMSAVMAGNVREPSTRSEILIQKASASFSYPHLLVAKQFCREAIEATITFDHLRKVRTRVCKRPDCMKPFPITSLHAKLYCDQYCAHLESMRRQSKKKAKRTKPVTQKRG